MFQGPTASVPCRYSSGKSVVGYALITERPQSILLLVNLFIGRYEFKALISSADATRTESALRSVTLC
jgi:hypothetical protein